MVNVGWSTRYPRAHGTYFGRGTVRMIISAEGLVVDTSLFTVSPPGRSLAIDPEDRSLSETPPGRSLAIGIPDRPV